MGKVPKTVILNQELIREKHRQKKYDDVCLSSWGHLDEFVQFLSSPIYKETTGLLVKVVRKLF
jgi:hypothetical protein